MQPSDRRLWCQLHWSLMSFSGLSPSRGFITLGGSLGGCWLVIFSLSRSVGGCRYASKDVSSELNPSPRVCLWLPVRSRTYSTTLSQSSLHPFEPVTQSSLFYSIRLLHLFSYLLMRLFSQKIWQKEHRIWPFKTKFWPTFKINLSILMPSYLLIHWRTWFLHLMLQP